MGLGAGAAKGRQGARARVQKSLTPTNFGGNPLTLAKSFGNPFISEDG